MLRLLNRPGKNPVRVFPRRSLVNDSLSEGISQAQLQVPVGTLGSHLAESGAGWVCTDSTEVRVVREVEHFATQTHSLSFCNYKILEDAKIPALGAGFTDILIPVLAG